MNHKRSLLKKAAVKKAALLAAGVVTAAAVIGPAEAALACSTGDACRYSAPKRSIWPVSG